jgi:hypothetical protein
MRRRTRLAGVLAAIGLAASMAVAGTGTARADVIPPDGHWAEIFNPHLHDRGITLCADDPGGSTSSGTRLQLWRCHGSDSSGAPQRWVFTQVEDINGNLFYDHGSPVYEIYNLGGQWCLNLSNQGLLPGRPLILGTCAGTLIMWFEIHATGNQAGPDFQLVPTFGPDMCVSASNSSDSNGTPLVMEPCDSSDARQLFNLG